jgi:hypothetical protein
VRVPGDMQKAPDSRDEGAQHDARRETAAHSTSNSSATSGSLPISRGISPRSGSSSPNVIRPRRSCESFEIQRSPSGSDGSCARSSSIDAFES